MARFLYSILFYLLTPVLLLRLWRRSKKAPAYGKRIGERFGFFTKPSFSSENIVWFHTVSVGEFIGAQPLIKWLLQQNGVQVVVTTMTPTGSEQVKSALGDRVFHVYAPYDTPTAVARFLNKVRPTLFISMETELWPNTLAACKSRKIPCLLINARLSERSFKGYEKFGALTRPMLKNLTKIGVQNSQDAQRFERLGIDASDYSITGNIKFDLALTAEIRNAAADFSQKINPRNVRRIFIAASTHSGEDEIILNAFTRVKSQLDEALLILVPRHPERFNQVHQLCLETGLSVVRRSEMVAEFHGDILLGDTMGELLMFYGASHAAFVGGSLIPNGGHNFIEAAVWGLPLVSGPHLFNFAEVSRLLDEAEALTIVADADALSDVMIRFLSDKDHSKDVGVRALTVAQNNRGALSKTQQIILPYITRSQS